MSPLSTFLWTRCFKLRREGLRSWLLLLFIGVRPVCITRETSVLFAILRLSQSRDVRQCRAASFVLRAVPML